MTLEKKLVIALKSHDKLIIEEVFNEIYHEYIKLIYFIIAQYVKNQLDIEELCNDVFLNFFNHLNRVKVTNIKYYLTTSAKNTSINWLKKNKISTQEITQTISEENKIICDFLKEHLTEDEEQLIFEHIYLGKSLRLIAKENNKNPNTLKSQYRRTILKLKEKVGVSNE